MKVLLIHTAKKNDNASRLRPLLEDMNNSVETMTIKSQDEGIITQFTSFFSPFDPERKEEEKTNALSHVAILSPLSKRWFDFLAGFSCGSRLPFIVFGEEAISGISEEFAHCFTFLNTDDSLHIFLESENEAFKKQEAARAIIRAQETLLKMGIPVTGESLAQCAGEGHVEEISLFLAAGFSPDTRNKTGVPLLNLAARKGNLEVVRFLIASGAQLNLQADDRGTSALIDSVMGKYYDLADELIRTGADVNIKSKDGQTALIVAVGTGDEKIVEVLLKAGADADISDSLGVSAKKYASFFHKESIMSLFDTYSAEKAM
ncbi:MAG: ankyrin repeat domain-containing protein [Spirochaetaceae bacterium]|jgi:hypothetical protein|nr:ankyrin repeat domain-containing protein [Spirochaetaceae bacterium]